ncbi:MAG: outer membrane beta-barrel protein [Flavobacteriales bacterium]
MRTALLVTGFLSILCASAQDSTRTHSSFEIGLYGSVDHCYRELLVREQGEQLDLVVDLRDDHELPRTSFAIGFEVAYGIGQHWFIESGLRYADLGWKTEEFNSFHATDPVTNDPAIPASVRYIDSFKYLGIPLIVRFRPGRHRLQFAPAMGFVFDAMVQHRYTSVKEWPDGNVTHETLSEGDVEYNTLSISAYIDLGVIYRINDHIAVRLAPTGRYQLTELVDAPITAHLWSVGLLAGVRYHF